MTKRSIAIVIHSLPPGGIDAIFSELRAGRDFLFGPQARAELRKLKDEHGEYLWQPGPAAGAETFSGLPLREVRLGGERHRPGEIAWLLEADRNRDVFMGENTFTVADLLNHMRRVNPNALVTINGRHPDRVTMLVKQSVRDALPHEPEYIPGAAVRKVDESQPLIFDISDA